LRPLARRYELRIFAQSVFEVSEPVAKTPGEFGDLPAAKEKDRDGENKQ
jgi:hypothetical protein